MLTLTAPADVDGALDEIFAPFEQPCQCAADAGCGTSRPATSLAYVASALSAFALTCGACCVLPFLIPALGTGILGAAVAYAAGLHGAAVVVAAVAAWLTIFASSRPAGNRQVLLVGIATLFLILALAWPQIEALVMH